MTYHTEVLSDTPAVYYKMNQSGGTTNMADSSGNLRDGSYSGTAGVSYVFSKPSLLATDSANTSVLFSSDGTDNPATPATGGTGQGAVGYSTWNGMNATGNIFSIEIWGKVNPALSVKTRTQTAQVCMSRRRTSSLQWEFRWGAASPTMVCWGPSYGSLGQFAYTSGPPAKYEGLDVGVSSGDYQSINVSGAVDISDGNPHYIALVRNGGEMRTFTDGVPSPTYWASGVESLQSNTVDPLVIAQGAQNGTHGFIGYLSNAAMYISALSASRILAHYTAGVGYSTYINAKWVLNGAQGMTLDDAVGAAAGFSTLRQIPLILANSVGCAAALSSKQRLGVVFADALSITNQIAVSPILQCLLANAVNINAALGMHSVAQFSLDAVVLAGIVIQAGDAAYNGWIVNPQLAASVMVEGFGFDSFAQFRGQYYAAKSEGIYRLGGDTDAGAPILSYIALPKTTFNTAKVKRVPFAYIGAASDGTMVLRVIAGGEQYDYAVRNPSTDMAEQRIDIGKGLKSNYWQFELINPGGADFSLDTIKFMPVILERRI